jgi:DNA-binding transcriptional ArsR family regulator
MHPSEKADLIIHPIRLRILQLLSREPLTIRKLDQLMPDVAKSSLYRHIRKLLDAGFIEIAETHPVKGTPENTYRLLQTPHITAEDVQQMSREDHLRYFSSYVAGLVQSFKAYLDSQDTPDLVSDRVGFSEILFYASTDEFDALFIPLRDQLSKISQQTPQPGRRLRKLVLINHPQVEEK